MDARAVIGLRYELDLRNGITNLPNYVFVEDASSEALAAILELNISGLKTEASTVRVYSTQYAAHILGYVGAMTKDQWEYYGSLEDQKYSMDAQVGQAGFELAFEEYLHGTDGWRVDVTYVDGTLKEQYYQKDKNGVEQKPVAGKNVEVTIDLGLQREAENAMQELINRYALLTDPDIYEGGRMISLEDGAFRGTWILTDALTEEFDHSIVQGIRSDNISLHGLCTGETTIDMWRELLGFDLGDPDTTLTVDEERAESWRIVPGTSDYYTFGDYRLRLHADENGVLCSVFLTR